MNESIIKTVDKHFSVLCVFVSTCECVCLCVCLCAYVFVCVSHECVSPVACDILKILHTFIPVWQTHCVYVGACVGSHTVFWRTLACVRVSMCMCERGRESRRQMG